MMLEKKLIQKHIDKALELWNFDRVRLLYENSPEVSDELKTDYASFLYESGQFEKLNELIHLNKDFDEKLSFKNCFKDLEYLKKINVQNIELWVENEDFSEQVGCFILNLLMKFHSLKAEFAMKFFKDKIMESKSVLTKSYAAASLINYFISAEEKEQEAFFVPMEHDTAHYYFLTFLHSQTRILGAKLYYQIYNSKTRDFFRKSIELPPKRIAICFYGMLRGEWKENLQETINTFAKPLNADCFLFSWDEYQEWVSLSRPGPWAWRFLKQECKRSTPYEVSDTKRLLNFFPRVYGKLHNEFRMPVKNQLKAFVALNESIKKWKVESDKDFNQAEFLQNKIYYGEYKAFELMQAYENGNEYDFVFVLRSDAKYTLPCLEELEKLEPNEIADIFFSGGSNSGAYCGYREAVKSYVYKHRVLKELQKSSLISNCSNHSIGYKHPVLMGYHIVKELFQTQLIDTAALNGLRFPNIDEELRQDCSALRGRFSEAKIQEILKFFEKIRENYKEPSKNARLIKKSINSRDLSCKNEGAKAKVHNHLAYKLGTAMIRDSKSLLGYLKMPFTLSSLALAHKEEQEKLKQNKQLPLEAYSDYKEALKEKECFTYKLGLALMKAQKNWYGGGVFEILLQRAS